MLHEMQHQVSQNLLPDFDTTIQTGIYPELSQQEPCTYMQLHCVKAKPTELF